MTETEQDYEYDQLLVDLGEMPPPFYERPKCESCRDDAWILTPAGWFCSICYEMEIKDGE